MTSFFFFGINLIFFTHKYVVSYAHGGRKSWYPKGVCWSCLLVSLSPPIGSLLARCGIVAISTARCPCVMGMPGVFALHVSPMCCHVVSIKSRWVGYEIWIFKNQLHGLHLYIVERLFWVFEKNEKKNLYPPRLSTEIGPCLDFCMVPMWYHVGTNAKFEFSKSNCMVSISTL